MNINSEIRDLHREPLTQLWIKKVYVYSSPKRMSEQKKKAEIIAFFVYFIVIKT